MNSLDFEVKRSAVRVTTRLDMVRNHFVNTMSYNIAFVNFTKLHGDSLSLLLSILLVTNYSHSTLACVAAADQCGILCQTTCAIPVLAETHSDNV